MQQYIAIKRFKRNGISGYANIPYGSILDKHNDGMLYYRDSPVCVYRSAVSHEYFAGNDDGKGLERGRLSHAIVKSLSIQTKDIRDERWKGVVSDVIALKYRRTEHADYWLWHDEFYNAPIEDLMHIARIVGIK